MLALLTTSVWTCNHDKISNILNLSCMLSQSGGAVCAVAVGAGKAAAGLTSGHAACLDARTGAPSAMWRAHQAAVSALTVLDDYHILTASQVSPCPLHTHLSTIGKQHCLALSLLVTSSLMAV